MTPKPDPTEEAQEQFSMAAKALLAIGGLGLFVGGGLMAFGHRPELIDPEALAATGAIIATVGALLWSAAVHGGGR